MAGFGYHGTRHRRYSACGYTNGGAPWPSTPQKPSSCRTRLDRRPRRPVLSRQWYSTSLWIANRDDRAASTRTEGFGLKYLLKTADYELRQWADIEFVPTRVLGPVMETGQARRHERATELREQRRARQHLDVGEAA